MAILVGIATALHTYFSWGAWQPRPVVSDEFSYVLQARIFASGHWVAPPPPSEPAFQQSHVIVRPVLASKYPPGHALLLAIGSLMRAVWVIPLALTGISGAVLFIVLAECGSTFAALCGWAYWLGDPLALRFRPGYWSENTSGLTWILAWWLVTRWRASPRRRYLVGLAVVVGWCAITRPLTAIALALPLAIYLLKPIGRSHAWKAVIVAGVAGAGVVSLLGAANYTVTGNPFKTAFALFAEQYLPFDKLGFHLDSTTPRFRLAAPNVAAYDEIGSAHVGHVPARLPSIAKERLSELAFAEWGGWRLFVTPLIAFGLWGLPAIGWLAVANGTAVFLIYLCWAHWPGWTIYYFEALPVFAFAISNGLERLGRRMPRGRVTFAVASGFVVLYVAGISRTTKGWRKIHTVNARPGAAFDDALKALPFAKSVVFVRYSDDKHGHPNWIVNSPTWQRDRVWVVNSWGPSIDRELMALSPQRQPLLFDEKTRTLMPYRELSDSLVAGDEEAGATPQNAQTASFVAEADRRVGTWSVSGSNR